MSRLVPLRFLRQRNPRRLPVSVTDTFFSAFTIQCQVGSPVSRIKADGDKSGRPNVREFVPASSALLIPHSHMPPANSVQPPRFLQSSANHLRRHSSTDHHPRGNLQRREFQLLRLLLLLPSLHRVLPRQGRQMGSRCGVDRLRWVLVLRNDRVLRRLRLPLHPDMPRCMFIWVCSFSRAWP